MSRAILFAAIAAIGLGSSGCVDRGAQAQAKETQKLISDPSKSVQVQPVSIQTIADEIQITGQVATSDDTQVGAKNPGRIVSVFVKEGDRVSAGQFIAVQDTLTQNAQLRSAIAALEASRAGLDQAIANAAIGPSKSSAAIGQAQATLASANAQLLKAKNGARPQERLQAEAAVQSAKSNMDTAEKQLARTKALYDQGVWTKQQLDQAQNAYDAAKSAYDNVLASRSLIQSGNRPEDIAVAQDAVRQAAEALKSARAQKRLDVLYDEQVQSAKANVQAAQAQVDIARQAIQDSRIVAPYSGTISGKPVQAGTVVGAGTSVARIIGTQGAYFEGQIPESDVPKIVIGTLVHVSVTALPNRVFTGHVTAINPLGQDIGRQFSTRVQLEGDISAVKPGMYAQGKVQARIARGATVVPLASIVTLNSKTYVFTVEGDKAKKVAVTIGLRSGDIAQVIGLPDNAKVVVSGQETLTDGATVKVQSPQGTAASGTGKGVGG